MRDPRSIPLRRPKYKPLPNKSRRPYSLSDYPLTEDEDIYLKCVLEEKGIDLSTPKGRAEAREWIKKLKLIRKRVPSIKRENLAINIPDVEDGLEEQIDANMNETEEQEGSTGNCSKS